MKLNICFNKTALHIAVEKENLEIVQYLVSQSNININMKIIKTDTSIKFQTLINCI